MRLAHLALIAALAISLAPAADVSGSLEWLDDVHSARAMEWVQAENGKTTHRLDADPRFPAMYREALAIAAAKDRLPVPSFQAGQIYNLWQDEQHPHGLWRQSTLASFRQSTPQWRTALDLDDLSAREQRNWLLKGVDCSSPSQDRCLLQLSDGGEDAVTLREFDLTAARFVEPGFVMPRGKQFAAWSSADELLAAREWSAGDLTDSGYPFIVKRLRRGQALGAAAEIFRGQKSDVQVMPVVLVDGAGVRAVLIERDVSFFEHEYYLVRPQGLMRLDLPLKADLQALVAGRLIVSLNAEWISGDGATFPQGSLIGLVLPSPIASPKHLRAELIYAPGKRDVLQQVGSAGNSLLVTLLDNVRGRARIYTPVAQGRWTSRAISLPDNASIDLVDTDRRGHQAFLNVTGFLIPASLWLVDLQSGQVESVKVAPANFDASRDIVEQREAISTDGTRIPYFVVHATDAPYDGSTPTVMTGYGGFLVSVTPYYGGYEWLHEPYYTSTGKLWLERGRTLVVANIRGGGEFGPSWHEAGLKLQRQRIYDDFAAVARDLIAQGITSPRRLGIFGWSNGGLLMGVEFTQHPELWAAVDMAVPLLDMMNYEHIEAGASWASEFGSVAKPEERAFLKRISPFENLKSEVVYPEPFIWSTTKDDRVGPEHARKFAAMLAAMGKPYLYFEAIDGGHDPLDYAPELSAAMQAREFVYFTQRLAD
jgi:prolyl oligopeptidase